MYNPLFEKLQDSDDISLETFRQKMLTHDFDKEVLDLISTVDDYNAFFDRIKNQQASARSPVSTIFLSLILNKISSLPSLRTSRYL